MALSPILARRADRAAKLKLASIIKQARADIALILRKKREIEDAFFDIGEALARLKPSHVVGAMGYRTFPELCKNEVKMSASQALRLIAITTRMTREEAAKLGSTKSAALLNLVDATPALDTPKGALTRGIALPGGKRLDVKKASVREIALASKAVRAATPKKEARGRSVSPDERTLGAKLEKRLHALGAKTATVKVLASPPGKPAHVRIEGLELTKLGALARAAKEVSEK